MRLGIFGGTFDPAHLGHLILAEACREACWLDSVWFVLARVAPHKANQITASQQARVEMLKLAIAGHPAFQVSTIELDRQGISYTVDTLQQIHRQRPDDQLFLLLGSDSLQDLPNWRSPDRICQLATLVVAQRAGEVEPDFQRLAPFVSPSQLADIRNHQVRMPLIGISSSAIRQAVTQGRSIRYLTPRAVEEYIRTHGLYT